MFISPTDNPETAPDKRAWANYVLYDGENTRFIAFFGTGRKTEENPGAYPTGLDIAESDDGIHWKWIIRDAMPITGAHAGFGVIKTGEYFYYYPTCSNAEKGVHFKIYRTTDFKVWEHPGDKYDVVPDRSMYHERWDEVHVISDFDEAGDPVYYGYISSEAHGSAGAGFMQSRDGISWEVLPPLQILWGEMPEQHMELNFVEKIDDIYYLSMSGRMYTDSYGYSLYTFTGSSPRGPFRPDREMFRLCGTTRREVTWLGHSIKTPDGFLCALWLSHSRPDIPSTTFAVGSLKRIITDGGHLRLAYWNGTDKAIGTELPAGSFKMIHPINPTDPRDGTAEGKGLLSINASRDGVIVSPGVKTDRKKGFAVRGTMTVNESRTNIATHHHSAAAGFYFEEAPGTGTAIIMETLGVTRIGRASYSEHRISDSDPYDNAGISLAAGRSGQLKGTFRFDPEDTVGPYGHASYCGIRHGRTHEFILLARGDYFELFIDNLYVQTYLLPETMTGVIGFCLFDGHADFRNIKIYDMTF